MASLVTEGSFLVQVMPCGVVQEQVTLAFLGVEPIQLHLEQVLLTRFVEELVKSGSVVTQV